MTVARELTTLDHRPSEALDPGSLLPAAAAQTVVLARGKRDLTSFTSWQPGTAPTPRSCAARRLRRRPNTLVATRLTLHTLLCAAPCWRTTSLAPLAAADDAVTLMPRRLGRAKAEEDEEDEGTTTTPLCLANAVVRVATATAAFCVV